MYRLDLIQYLVKINARANRTGHDSVHALALRFHASGSGPRARQRIRTLATLCGVRCSLATMLSLLVASAIGQTADGSYSKGDAVTLYANKAAQPL